eukprot:6455531-Amphidinium_carterae.1
MKPGVPILLDEVKVGEKRGTRPPMTVEDLKHLCEVAGATTVDARNSDVKFAEEQPRIMTANASDPNKWHPELPENVFSMSVAGRKSLPADVKAVFKRCSFVHMQKEIISKATRDAWNSRCTAM